MSEGLELHRVRNLVSHSSLMLIHDCSSMLLEDAKSHGVVT